RRVAHRPRDLGSFPGQPSGSRGRGGIMRPPRGARPGPILRQTPSQQENGMQRMWIDGRWTASVTKKTFPIDNPATEEIIDEVPRAGSKDADLAVESAAEAF